MRLLPRSCAFRGVRFDTCLPVVTKAIGEPVRLLPGSYAFRGVRFDTRTVSRPATISFEIFTSSKTERVSSAEGTHPGTVVSRARSPVRRSESLFLHPLSEFRPCFRLGFNLRRPPRRSCVCLTVRTLPFPTDRSISSRVASAVVVLNYRDPRTRRSTASRQERYPPVR